MLLAGMLLVQPLWAGELEEEEVNASEVTFQNGVPIYYEGGHPVKLKTRQQDGRTVYYRMVRYDAQEGYVDETGRNIAADGNYISSQTDPTRNPNAYGRYPLWGSYGYGYGYGHRGVWRGYGYGYPGVVYRGPGYRGYGYRGYGYHGTRAHYYGAGLYGPDYYQSPYNRDTRKFYSGPGYVGACDWRGCRGVSYVAPVYIWP